MIRVVGTVITLALAAPWLFAGEVRADAAAAARCVVNVIHALNEGEGVDPRLERLKPKLLKAPFTAWKQFKLLDTKDLTIASKATERITLPNGKVAALTFLDHLHGQGGKHRLRTQLEVIDGDKKLLHTVFVLDEGGVVLQAGQQFGGGLLILSVSCETKD